LSSGADQKVLQLLSLMSNRTKSKKKIEILNQIETIRGYDLVFILSLITQNNYSGSLILVNEENDLSSITFIYGDIVKVDYPDHEHLLGNLIVQYEVLSKYEMQEIASRSGVVRLGDYLVEQNHITQAQLRKILFKQSTLRLGKYLSSLSLRVKFSFDGESSENVLINKMDYLDILYNWIFKSFEDEWFEDYSEYYSRSGNSFFSNMGMSEIQFFKEYPEVFDVAFRIAQLKKNSLNYHDLFVTAGTTRLRFLKILHFLILAGALSFIKNKESGSEAQLSEQKVLLRNLDRDLKVIRENLLAKKYYEAFGLLNQYSRYMHTHPVVQFYFIWIKLIGVFEHSHIIDVEKISREFYSLDQFSLSPAEFHYVSALMLAVQQKYRESDEAFAKAVSCDANYQNYPLNQDDSFMKRIIKFFNRLNIDKKDLNEKADKSG
jgi:hypothetical protein